MCSTDLVGTCTNTVNFYRPEADPIGLEFQNPTQQTVADRDLPDPGSAVVVVASNGEASQLGPQSVEVWSELADDQTTTHELYGVVVELVAMKHPVCIRHRTLPSSVASE